jgi:D-alanyl-D-alanine carboxypeptidase
MAMKTEKLLSRMVLFQIILVFVTFIHGVSIASDLQTSVNSETSSSLFGISKIRQLQQLLDQKVTEYGIPGAAMAVYLPGKYPWVFAAGVSSLSDRRPVTKQDKFRIGSNTKTFVAMTILQLAQEGKLSLDDSLAQWLPGILANYDNGSNTITIRHMLQHTSGIYSFTEDGTWGMNFLTNTYYRYAPEDLLAIANAYAPYCNPGECFHYSNTNYVLLGLIIQRATGNRFEEEVRKRFIEPLGLTNTIVPLMGYAGIPGSYSNGHDDMDGHWYDYTQIDPSSTWSSGDMISTAEDLAKWVLHLGRGDLLNEQYRNEQRQFVNMAGYTSLKYGLGVVFEPDFGLFGHQGGIVGYSTQMYYVEGEDTALVFLYNRTFPPTIKNFSVVMTYDVLPILFPNRTWPSQAKGAERISPPARRPGLLNEY